VAAHLPARDPAGPEGRRVTLRVAHRAGNRSASLRRAAEVGADLVEADLWLHRGAVELRHRRRAGPVTWDRTGVGWGARVPGLGGLLSDLAALGPGAPEPMLDLKGGDARLAERVADALADGHAGPVTVCSRAWALLDPFIGRPHTRVLHSAGDARELAALRRSVAAGRGGGGASVRESLIPPGGVRGLQDELGPVFAWTLRDPARARALAAEGVAAVISSDLTLLAGLRP
jgi:glycerophosphoryl diester phosphodiesterase